MSGDLKSPARPGVSQDRLVRQTLLEAMEGEGVLETYDVIDDAFGPTRVLCTAYTPEAEKAADAFLAALPAVREALCQAYLAVADFGPSALEAACDLLSDLDSEARDLVEKGQYRPSGLPRAVATVGSLSLHLARLAAVGIKATRQPAQPRKKSLAKGLPPAIIPTSPGKDAA